jgi:alkyl sulfatase BDS1-like metallo-beta-lactamase superfamily hydrolase
MAADALEALETEFEEATDRARRLVDSTDPRRFTVRPNPSSWSAAECIAHLSVSTDMFLPVLRKALDEAKQLGVAENVKLSMDWIGAVLRWFLEPPVRSRVKTTAPLVPRAVRAKKEAFAEFISLQTKLVDMLHEARGLDLRRAKIVSPFDKRVKYNVYSAFRIVAAHQRRHLWQAEQALAALNIRKSA